MPQRLLNMRSLPLLADGALEVAMDHHLKMQTLDAIRDLFAFGDGDKTL